MSERWTKITIEDVASYQAGALVKALESKAKYSDAQENPLEVAIERITARIRSDVKSGGFSVDIDAAKIPGELTAEAVALIVEFAKPRLMQKLTADEMNLANAARARLDKIAEGKIKPSLPDNPEPNLPQQAFRQAEGASSCAPRGEYRSARTTTDYKNEKGKMNNYFEEDFIMATIIFTISAASLFIAESFLALRSFVSSQISSQKSVSSASSNAIRIFAINSALLRAHCAARIFAATLLPLRAICDATVLPVKFFGRASASLNILTANVFVLAVISGVFISAIISNSTFFSIIHF